MKVLFSQKSCIVLLIYFSNIKKVYLQISKYLAQFFCLFFFSNIKKMNTYKS